MNTRYREFNKAIQIPCLYCGHLLCRQEDHKMYQRRVSEDLQKTLMRSSTHLWIGHWKGVVFEGVSADGILISSE